MVFRYRNRPHNEMFITKSKIKTKIFQEKDELVFFLKSEGNICIAKPKREVLTFNIKQKRSH